MKEDHRRATIICLQHRRKIWSATNLELWALGGAVGRGTALQTGRSRVPFRPQYDPGFDSFTNRNEYQEYFLGGKGGPYIGLTTLPPSCADCLEFWEPQTPGNLRDCPGL